MQNLATVSAALAASSAIAFAAHAAITPVEITEIIALDGATDDYFGTSVDLDGDHAIIGSRWDDDTGLNTGSAYIFERDAAGAWQQAAKFLPPPGATVTSHYAHAVAISDGWAAVGAYGTNVNGTTSGAVHIYARNINGSWGYFDTITPNDPVFSQGFGRSVDLDGTLLVVGASTDSPGGVNSGSAYVFLRNGDFDQIAKLIPSAAVSGAGFGIDVAASNNTVLIGAISDFGASPASGAAYVYTQTSAGPFGEAWAEQQKLVASDGVTNHFFGFAVALDADTAIIGAFGVSSQGAAYAFDRDAGGLWTETQILTAAAPEPGDAFGYAVALDSDTALIAAYHDNGNAGSATLFRRDTARGANPWSDEALIETSDSLAWDEFGYALTLDSDTAIIGAPRTDDMGSAAGSAYVFELNACIADINGDNAVDTADLGIVIGAFGSSEESADLNADGVVDTADLGIIVGAFGPCE